MCANRTTAFQVWDTSIVFVNSHLAAHQSKVKARNANYRDIVRGIRLDGPEAGAAAAAAGDRENIGRSASGSLGGGGAKKKGFSLFGGGAGSGPGDGSGAGGAAAGGAEGAEGGAGAAGQVLGHMDLLTAFHHVVWMGDLNYR